MIEHVLVPKSVWSLRFSVVEEELCSTLRNTINILGVYVEAHRNRLVNFSWSRFVEKRVLVVDLNEVRSIRRFQDSEWVKLDWNLEWILTSNLLLCKLNTVGCRGHVVIPTIQILRNELAPLDTNAVVWYSEAGYRSNLTWVADVDSKNAVLIDFETDK